MQLEDFLRAVLPSQGIKCWTSIQNKIAKNHFCNTFEELAEQIIQSNALGADTYHACATFKTNANRRAANAGWMKAFWLDIDCGEGKPYATIEDAIRACDEFCDRLGIPVPGLVRSGSGAHAYWCLDRAIDSEEWSGVAKRLKLLTQAYGLHCDPSRTADLASILRPPGTQNYKIPTQPRPVEVECSELFEPVSADEFLTLITSLPLQYIAPQIKNPSVTVSENIKSPLTAGISKAFDPTIGVAAGSRGSTQLKYAGELVAKGYQEKDVIEACLVWNQLCTPPQDEKEVRRVVASAFTMHAQRHPAPVQILQDEPLPELPYGFRWVNNQQLVMDDTDENGKIIPHILSDRPVYLKAMTNLEGKEQHNSYLFRLLHAQKGWQEFTLTAEQVNRNEWYAEFAKRGGTINPGKDKYFKLYMRAEEREKRMANESIQYNQLGWKNNEESFLVGDTLLHGDGRVEKIVGTPKLQPIMQMMKPRGTLEGWSVAASKFTTKGCEPLLAFIIASAAAPLIPFCVDAGNGGCVFSMRTEGSGYGKTPTVQAVASVWGNMGAARVTGKYTWNRRMEEIVRRCNLPLIEEEMPLKDGIIASQNIKEFTDGTSKGRLNQRGEAVGEPEYYQTILMSVSNASLYELVHAEDKPMARRIFELEPDAKPPKEILENLGGITRDMENNCGRAGLQMMRLTLRPEVLSWVKSQLRGVDGQVGETLQKYRKLLQSEEEHRYIVGLLSGIEIEARLLNSAKIMEFDVNRLMAYLIDWAKYLMGRGDYIGNAIPQSVRALQTFLSSHANTILAVQGPHDKKRGPMMPLRLPHHKLFMRLELATERLFIDNKPLQEWCTKQQISFRDMGRNLKELGIVKETSKIVTLGAGTEIASARANCWEVDMAHEAMGGIAISTADPADKVLIMPKKI